MQARFLVDIPLSNIDMALLNLRSAVWGTWDVLRASCNPAPVQVHLFLGTSEVEHLTQAHEYCTVGLC